MGELPISISGDPEQHDRLVYTVRSVGQQHRRWSASRWATAWVSGGLSAQAGRYGGARKGRDGRCGRDWLAPLRPLIYRSCSNRKEYGRLMLLYGARSPRDLLYRKELRPGLGTPTLRCLSRWITEA